MTKLKNTKKGMAKKALSISLVAAMLATSNVPVWAAEFTDGTDAVVEAPVVEEFAAEAPVEEVVDENTSLSSVITEGDVSVDLTADKKSVPWSIATDANYKVNITGTVTKKDGSALANGWKYRWVDENGIVLDDQKLAGTATDVADMGKQFGKEAAGKTLTLHVYDVDVNNQYLYDIATDIKVAVEKRELKDFTVDTSDLAYDGFAQTKGVEKVTDIVDALGGTVTDAKDYTVTLSSATKVGETIKATVTANADSAYTGTVTKDAGKISKRTYKVGDIIANTEKGQSYQYTGELKLSIPKEKVTLKESLSANNGEDEKLSGEDLSKGIVETYVTNQKIGDNKVVVTVDKTKFDNIDLTTTNPGYFETEETVEIKKRDLSTAGTKITVNTLSGEIPTTATKANLSSFLNFTGVEGSDLSAIKNSSDEYAINIKNPDGTDASTLVNGATYKVTVTAKTGGHCTGEQSFNVVATAAALSGVVAKTPYETFYTGNKIEPSKADLGTLEIGYYNEQGNVIKSDLDTSAYEIVGYTNNTDASKKYDSSNQIIADAYVKVKITSGTYKDQIATIPFLIKPLEVKPEYVTVPKDVSINKNYKEADEYKLPLTVVAKDTTGKIVKALTEGDYTVKQVFGNKSDGNILDNTIKTTVTVTNSNYILGTTDGKTKKVEAQETTTIVAKKLTDSMVVVNPSSYTYTGGKIEPTYSVVDGVIVLYKEGEVDAGKAEYKEVGVTNALNVGTATITVEGVNKLYSGTAKGTFTITPANTKDVKIEIEDQDYTGRQVRPRKFKATLNGNDVTDQFEIVSYGTNVEAGKGSVVLKPMDSTKNFTGNNITADFNIVKEKITANLDVYDAKGFKVTDDYDLKLDENGNITSSSATTFKFDGNAKTFTKEVLSNLTKVGGGKTTATVDDLEIKYVDNVSGKKVGNNAHNIAYVYAVAKEGTGFAGGETIVTADGTIIKGVVAKLAFGINSVRFVAENVTVKNGTYAAGLVVKPEILVQIGGNTLVEGKDYKVEVFNATTKEPVAPTEVTVGKIYGVTVNGINGYAGSNPSTKVDVTWGLWGIDKKNIADCNVTVKDGVVTVLNGYIPVASTEYTAKENADGTYTITANKESKNYTGSKTVVAEGQKPAEGPEAPVITDVKVVGNKATVVLSGECEGATGYDYVISTENDYKNGRLPNGINKNQLTTKTSYQYLDQGIYYAYCHAWKKVDGKKVFSGWSNIYPFAVTSITPSKPVITSVKVSKNTVKVTYTKSANATGYDIVLGKSMKKVNGEMRPVEYGKLVKKVYKGNTVTATFTKVGKGTYYAGLHAYNRTSEDGKKVFSPWSNAKKVVVK